MRRQFAVAIIDDLPFVHREQLENHGFDIAELGDIKSIAAVEAYAIVACDISGVGVLLGSSIGGAHIVAEIRKRYPNKYIIAYTAGKVGPEYKSRLDSADVFVRRGISVDDWAEALDNGIHSMGDPLAHWRRLRHILLDHGFSTFDVMLLEDAFVQAIDKRDEFILGKAIARARRLRDVGALIESVGGGLITVTKLAIAAGT